MSATDQSIESVLRLVQEKLNAKRDATGLHLQIPEGGYRRDEDWIEIIVRPAQNGIRAYDYVDALVEVEDELRKEGYSKILLVPAMAD
jgi:hypothetical protein